MDNDLQKRIAEAMQNPRNMGELTDADAVGTVGNPECGEMLRMWVKFKQENGKKIIDRATFQSFGCETAIAVASLATELIRGKTVEEALTMKGAELAGELGPLPPMKIHCSQLVERAITDAYRELASAQQPNFDPASLTVVFDPAPDADRWVQPGARTASMRRAEARSRSLWRNRSVECRRRHQSSA
jgi:NifU-like protein involved in Fe-S cluster formation